MFLFVSASFSLISVAYSTLVVISAQRNVSVEFEDAEASFGAPITEDMPMGKISESFPHNACSAVKPPPNRLDIFFALIRRGDCTFAEKVLAVQEAQFSGAIIVNTDSDYVFPMSSNATFNVNIPAIMVGRSSGKTIRDHYLFQSGYLARMKPNPGTVIEYYLVPFLITLSLAFFGIIIFLAFRVLRTCLRQSKNRLSRESLNKLPEIRYSEDYQNLYETCAICLEDYAMGDKLRVLPCHHAYHSKCVDRWLLRRQGSCPVCKFRINRNHDDVDTDAEDNNVEEEDEEGVRPSNSLVDRTGAETIEAPQPTDAASTCEPNTERGDDDSAPLLSKSAPSTSWLSGGQLPSNGTAWLGYDNPAVETVDESGEFKVDFQTRELGSSHSISEAEEGEGQPQTLSCEEEKVEHHNSLPTLDV